MGNSCSVGSAHARPFRLFHGTLSIAWGTRRARLVSEADSHRQSAALDSVLGCL